jgi:hypothetical protein
MIAAMAPARRSSIGIGIPHLLIVVVAIPSSAASAPDWKRCQIVSSLYQREFVDVKTLICLQDR